MTVTLELSYFKGIFILLLDIMIWVTISQASSIHDSECEDNSWIDHKFWQRFYQTLLFYFIERLLHPCK